MRYQFSLLLMVGLLALPSCASTPRTLAVGGYKVSQASAAAQAATKTANVTGVLPTPIYTKFLDAAEVLNKAGVDYSRSVIAYLANADSTTMGNLQAALVALQVALAGLPAVLAGPTKDQVTAITDGPKPALAKAQKAIGGK